LTAIGQGRESGEVMDVRTMILSDVIAVCELVRAAFFRDVAPSMTETGVANFLAYIAPQALEARLATGHQTWVAQESGLVVGVLQVRSPRHLCMLFVSPNKRRRGVARGLWTVAKAALDAHAPHGAEVTVKSSLYAVPAYKGFGFTCAGEVIDEGGIISQPMVFSLAGARD